MSSNSKTREIIKQENTKSLTRFEPRSCIVGSTANEFIIIAFCFERAGLVAVKIWSGVEYWHQKTLQALAMVLGGKDADFSASNSAYYWSDQRIVGWSLHVAA